MTPIDDWNRRTVLIGGLAAASCATVPAERRPEQKRPNILFIMADDLGYADVSCFGRRDFETPAIDSLARDGMKFTQAYSNSSVCTPTRVALATGQYQYRLPIGLQEPHFNADVGLPPSQATLPSLLKASGYHTSLVGKWHMGALPNYGPLKSGYDEFLGIRSGGVDYFTHDLFGTNGLWDGETSIEETGYITDLLGQRALEILDERAKANTPFFMSLHFTAPHWPWQGPEDQAESERMVQLPPHGIIHYDGGTLETYAAMVTSMDQQIGRVLRRLETLGLAANTIIVFTSDNGGERFSDTWPFSGRKSELLEGGIRVPTLIRWQGRIPAGSVNETPMMTMDWVPTLLSAVGLSDVADIAFDGIDISSTFSNAQLADRKLYWRHGHLDQKAVRSGVWKYLSIDGNTFLFDVVADPLERGNLKGRFPDVFAVLEADFEAWNSEMLKDDTAFSTGLSSSTSADRYGSDWP